MASVFRGAVQLDKVIRILHKDETAKWVKGQWSEEPDLIEFVHNGYFCRIKRCKALGVLKGSITVPQMSPFYRKCPQVVIHGGLRVFKDLPGVWEIGFECSTTTDLSPALETIMAREDYAFLKRSDFVVYRDVQFVTAEIRSLVRQLRSSDCAEGIQSV